MLHEFLSTKLECLREMLTVLAEGNLENSSLRILLNRGSAVKTVAGFVLRIAERLAARSHSSTDLYLSMSRYDIASYLSTALETVSCALSKLTRQGFIAVFGKHIHINDRTRLAAYVDDESPVSEDSDSLRAVRS